MMRSADIRKEECNVSEYDEEVTAESELKDIFHALSVRHHNKIIDPSTLIHQMALKHLKVKQKDVAEKVMSYIVYHGLLMLFLTKFV